MILADDLRKAVLQAAIQGKLVPQVVNDEPASILMEKIKAEKAQLIKEKKIMNEKPLSPIKHDQMPFDIPESWEFVRLNDIIKISSGDGLTSKQMIEGLIPVYGGNGITGYHNKSNVEKPTLVIGRVGFYCGSIHITEKEAWVTDNAFITTFIETNIDINFLALMLKAMELGKKSQSTAQPVVSGKSLYPLVAGIPPFAEQCRIVSKVQELMAKIDEFEAIEKELKSIKKAIPDDMKKSLLQATIMGKLTEQHTADGSAQDLIKKIEKETNTHIETNYEDDFLIDIPETWVYVKLGEVLSIARGGSPRPIKAFLTDSQDGINWMKIGDSDKGGKYINSTNEKIKPEGMVRSRFVRKGDFLLSNSMSFGRPYILNINGCIHDGWLVLSNVDLCFDKDFLYYLLSSMFIYYQFCGKVSGAVVSNLNSDKVRDTIVPLPPLEEQFRIVEKLDKLLPCCEGLVE